MKSAICVLLLISAYAYTQKVEGCPLAHPGPDVMSLTDESAQMDLMKRTITSWKDAQLTRKDLSGAGGAKLFMYEPTDQSVRPVGAVLKIMPTSSTGKTEVSLSDRIVNDAACALQQNDRTSVAKRAEGSNWFIQDSAGFQGQYWDMQYPPALVGELMARMHKTPTKWAEKWFKDVEKNYPKEVAKWPKITSSYWALRASTPADAYPVLDALQKWESAVKWNSPISKRLVTMHGDFHGYNFLWSDHTHKRLTVIDLDTMWVGSALADLARNTWTMNLNFKNKYTLFQSYLQHFNGKKPTKKEILDLMMDAELFKISTPVEGMTSKIFAVCPNEFINNDGWKNAIRMFKKITERWMQAYKSTKDKWDLVKRGLWKYLLKFPEWKKFVNGQCGQRMAWLQPHFRENKKFEVKMGIQGTDAKKAATWLNDVSNVFMSAPVKATMASVTAWNDLGKGGFKAVRKEDESAPLFFGPLKKGWRQFVQGTTRKSGYPYALFTGKMHFAVDKKDGKLTAKLMINQWHQMSLGAPDQLKVFQESYLKAWLDIWVKLWNATNPKRRMMVENH